MKNKPSITATNFGEITKSEVERVCKAVEYLRGSENRKLGALLKCDGKNRVWQVSNDDAVINIVGGESTFEGTYLLSPQFLINCRLMTQFSETVNIKYEDRKAHGNNRIGSVTMKCEKVTTEFVKVQQLPIVEARVKYRALFRAIDTGSDLPCDFGNAGEITSETPPTTSLIVEPGRLRVKTIWSRLGSDDVETSCRAKTSGQGEISVMSPLVNLLTAYIGTDGDPDFIVRFDPLNGDYIEFVLDDLYVALKRTLVGVDLAFERIKKILDKNEVKYVVGDSGVIAAHINGVATRIALLKSENDENAIARCTAVVLNDAHESASLLKELNGFNKSFTASRVWLDRSMVVVGCDVSCSNLFNFYNSLDKFSKEAGSLLGLLDALGAEPAITKIRKRTFAKPRTRSKAS
ncbi:MAG: hypothetical protein ACKOAE_09755 [Acidimicrobiaceae bacterium]